VIDEESIRRDRRWRIIAIGVLVIVGLGVAGGWVLYRRQHTFGTIWADKAPPRIDRCDRRWYKGDTESARATGLNPLRRVGSTPGGAAILAAHTGCPEPVDTLLWVQLGVDSFVAYSLSGGP